MSVHLVPAITDLASQSAMSVGLVVLQRAPAFSCLLPASNKRVAYAGQHGPVKITGGDHRELTHDYRPVGRKGNCRIYPYKYSPVYKRLRHYAKLISELVVSPDTALIN
jgi:hypothetical protein